MRGLLRRNVRKDKESYIKWWKIIGNDDSDE